MWLQLRLMWLQLRSRSVSRNFSTDDLEFPWT